MKDSSFLKQLKTISEKKSGNIAFCIEGKNYSYLELYQKVNDIAHFIIISKKLRS